MDRRLLLSAFAALLALGCGQTEAQKSALDAGATSSPDSATTCSDTTSDPHNCGACGHDCFGATCTAGTCAPLPVTVLATGQSLPAGIAVDDSGVYWINLGVEQGSGKAAGPYTGGAVMTCAKGGCPSGPTTLASGLTQILSLGMPAPILAAGGNVYFGDVTAQNFSGQIQVCATSGCSGTPSVFATALPWAMAANGASLFWTGGDQGFVQSCPLGGCEGAPVTLFSPPAQQPPLAEGIAADATAAYWIVTGVNDNVVSCPVTGCNDAPSPLGDTLPMYSQIVADAHDLYFTNTNPLELGAILTCPKSGCAGSPAVLASHRSGPHGIAVDGARVYWTETGDNVKNGVAVPNAGAVYACAVTGCGDSPTVLAAGQEGPMGIAVDDSRVYWTTFNQTGGQVLSVAKP